MEISCWALAGYLFAGMTPCSRTAGSSCNQSRRERVPSPDLPGGKPGNIKRHALVTQNGELSYFTSRGAEMKRLLLVAAATLIAGAAVMSPAQVAGQDRRELTAVTPEGVPWFTPSYYQDGRQRAHLFGDSDQGGAWIDRVKIP